MNRIRINTTAGMLCAAFSVWMGTCLVLRAAENTAGADVSGGEKKALLLKGRLINLKQMAGIWILVKILKKPTTVKLDNLRLVAAGGADGETRLPMITDKSPFAVPAVLAPSSPKPRETIGWRVKYALRVL